MLDDKLNVSRREATEEYLAMIAEEGFDDAEDAKFFTRVKNLFLNMLKAVGISFKNILTDEDLKYILWQSKRNLEKGDIVSNAKKALTRSQLRKDAEDSHNKKTGKTPPDGGKGSCRRRKIWIQCVSERISHSIQSAFYISRKD